MAEMFEQVWPALEAALNRGDERGLPKQDLADRLAAGLADLWVGRRSALVAYPTEAGGQRVACAWLGAGDLRELLSFRPALEAWGRAHGCDFAAINGRPGWARLLHTFGYRPLAGELRKPL